MYIGSGGIYQNALFNGRGEIHRFGTDERLYSDHYAKTSAVNDVDGFFHSRKSFLVQRKIAHFRLPKLIEQHVAYINECVIIIAPDAFQLELLNLV